MSASLVGSEMCIRDRLWMLRRARADVGIEFMLGNSPYTAEPRRTVTKACLLYTSDAADDM
eukprot:14955546-Alexandrium_andersonii.AAC.1